MSPGDEAPGDDAGDTSDDDAWVQHRGGWGAVRKSGKQKDVRRATGNVSPRQEGRGVAEARQDASSSRSRRGVEKKTALDEAFVDALVTSMPGLVNLLIGPWKGCTAAAVEQLVRQLPHLRHLKIYLPPDPPPNPASPGNIKYSTGASSSSSSGRSRGNGIENAGGLLDPQGRIELCRTVRAVIVGNGGRSRLRYFAIAPMPLGPLGAPLPVVQQQFAALGPQIVQQQIQQLQQMQLPFGLGQALEELVQDQEMLD